MSAITPQLKTESAVIDGIKFETTQFAAMRGYKLLTKLVKSVGPALGLLATAQDGDSIESMAPALGAALSNLTEQDAQSLLLEILAATTAEIGTVMLGLGTQVAIDGVFSGKLSTMFKVVAHALKVNYADFFGGTPDEAAEATRSQGSA